MKKKFETLLMLILVLDAPVSTAPQIMRMIQTGSSHDVSILTWSGLFLMACLWTWVAHKESSRKLVIGSALWGVADLTVAIIASVLRFK